MTVRDHRNPYLLQRKREDRERRAAARKNRKPRDFGATRARLAQDLLNMLNSN